MQPNRKISNKISSNEKQQKKKSKVQQKFICKNCNESFLKQSDLVQHDKFCKNASLSCMFCKQKITRAQNLDHLTKFHTKQLELYLVAEFSNQNAQIQIFDKFQEKKIEFHLFNPLQPKLNRAKNKAQKGSNGKYYCGFPLKTPCPCDGFCGPTNGCNCVNCMILGLQSRNIHNKNYLINNKNQICKIEKGLPFCGKRIVSNSQIYCEPTNRCKDCDYLVIHGIIRYKQLYDVE